MKFNLWGCVICAAVVPNVLAAGTIKEEDIIVTAPFQQSAANTALPVSILSGESLRQSVSNNLGDTLKGLIGVHSASFGPGVGQPIIRGQSGKRVQVLQNGIALNDAASVSPDHANGLAPILAERIEVVRGPATLLYGSGAIGGVVNVIDQRIPSRRFDQPDLVFEQSFNSVNQERKSLFGATTSIGDFGFHLDGFYRDNNNVKTSQGFINNSHGRGDGVSVGASWIFGTGFIGISGGETNNQYGLPATGTFTNEPSDDETIRIAMKQRQFNIKAETSFASGFIESAQFSFGVTDYKHDEIEIESDGTRHLGTQFSNKGYGARTTLTHAEFAGWTGVWGLQISATTFSAVGEEGFIPKTDINQQALFFIERFSHGKLTTELGARFESSQLDPELGANTCRSDDNALSFSAGLLYDLTPQTNLMMTLSKSERVPTIEERYSNIDAHTCARPVDNDVLVLHAATSLVEIGDPNINNETSSNIELGIKHKAKNGQFELNIFYNQMKDYIFLTPMAQAGSERQFAIYQSADTRFIGLETAYEIDIASDWRLRIFADLVRAKFKRGGYVPRIPPARIGTSIGFYRPHWTLSADLVHVFDQNSVADQELKTEGHDLLSLYADYRWELSKQSQLVLFIKANNLLDQEVRNHASFLKNVAPEPGRAFTLGLRFKR